jgi:hypothetical protein
MSNVSIKHSPFFIWIGFFMLCVAGSFVLWNRLEALVVDVREARQALFSQQHVAEQTGVSSEEYEQLAVDVALLRERFADRQNPLPLIRSLEEMAVLYDVSVNVNQVQEDVKADEYSAFLVISGTFDAVETTLRALEAFPYIVNMHTVVLEKTDMSADMWKMQLSVRVPMQFVSDTEK